MGQCTSDLSIMPPSARRASGGLDWPCLVDGKRHRLTAGMLVCVEVNPGSRTVMVYLLSRVRVRFPGDQTIMTQGRIKRI